MAASDDHRWKPHQGIGRCGNRHKALAAELGLELQQAMAGGGSDGNTTSQHTATLDGLGPVGGGAHAKHEFLYIDKTLERAALLTMLMLAPEIAA